MSSRLSRLVGTMTAGVSVFACEARPIPMMVIPDSTFILPLQTPAFGNALSRSLGVEDRQRGDLVVAICPQATPYCSPPAVPGNCATPPTDGFYLETRYVTTVMPHPASNAGLRGYLEIPNNPMEPNWGLSGQDLALLEVPANACPGTYELSVRSRPVGSLIGQDEMVAFLGVDIVVVDAPGVDAEPNPTSANPLGASDLNIDPDLVDLVPNPTVLIRLTDPYLTSSYPAAAEIVIDYPPTLVEVLGAYQDKHLGLESLVSWIDDPVEGRVAVSVIDPTRCTGEVRVAFALRSTEPVDVLTQFTAAAENQKLYDRNGSAVSGNPYVVAPSTISPLLCGTTP
jgi:hypothetical protein